MDPTPNVTQPAAPQPAVPPPSAAPATPAQLYFPLKELPEESYKTGPRAFASYRTPTRIHAGVDLYHPMLSPIRAIADGTVVQPAYFFYDGTNALEVIHPGIGLVRYGEISPVKVVKFAAGEKVKAGQLIAYVGLLVSLKRSMIHFELYSNTAAGPLTVRSNLPFQRRKDLVNPTSLVDKLVKATFG
jgi:murein DD-endopeptidase MepM/ murein hydrolase activator NlpD